MADARINKVLKELKEFEAMKKEIQKEIDILETECKQYMTDNELKELFSDDMSIVARYTEVVSNRFDVSALKASEWNELVPEFTKTITSMRFSVK